MKKYLAIISVFFAIALLMCAGFFAVAIFIEPLPKAPTPTTQVVETAEGYRFVVPGSAYMDGRSLDADPPLTIMKISIWDDVPRVKVHCQVSHGDPVALTEVLYYEPEARYYFLVRRDDCKGWLSEPFLSDTPYETVGDLLW